MNWKKPWNAFALIGLTPCLVGAQIAMEPLVDSSSVPPILSTEAVGNAWHFSAGPAWRTGMKLTLTPRSTVGVYDNGSSGMPDEAGLARDWYGGETSSETYLGTTYYYQSYSRVPHEALARKWDSEDAMGLSMGLTYDVVQCETFDLGIRLSFAAYWGMEVNTAFHSQIDTYSFVNTQLSPTEFEQHSGNKLPLNWNEITTSTAEVASVLKVKGSLYQVGFGPTFTYRPCSYVSLYFNPEGLLNYSRLQLSGDLGSAEKNEFLWGFGLNLGMKVTCTDTFSLYGELGYEWIEKTSVAVPMVSADMDYSAWTIKVGLCVRF